MRSVAWGYRKSSDRSGAGEPRSLSRFSSSSSSSNRQWEKEKWKESVKEVTSYRGARSRGRNKEKVVRSTFYHLRKRPITLFLRPSAAASRVWQWRLRANGWDRDRVTDALPPLSLSFSRQTEFYFCLDNKSRRGLIVIGNFVLRYYLGIQREEEDPLRYYKYRD